MKKLLALFAIVLGLQGFAQPYLPPFEYVSGISTCVAFPLNNTTMIPLPGGANYKAQCQIDEPNGDLKIKFPIPNSPHPDFVFSHVQFVMKGVEFDPTNPVVASASIFDQTTTTYKSIHDVIQTKSEDYYSPDGGIAYAHFNLPNYNYSYYVVCRAWFKSSGSSTYKFTPSGFVGGYNDKSSGKYFAYTVVTTSNTSIVNYGALATTDYAFVNENYTTNYTIEGQSRTVPVYCENEEVKVNAGIASCSNVSKFTLNKYHTDLQIITSIISYPEMQFVEPFNVINLSDLMLNYGVLLPGVYKMEFQSLPGGSVVSKYFEIKESQIGGRVDASSLHTHTFPNGGNTIQYYGLASNSTMNVFNTSSTLCEDLYMMKVFQLDNNGNRIDCPIFCSPSNCNVGIGPAPNITLPSNTFAQETYYEIEWSANVNGSWDIESYYFKISSSFNQGGGLGKKSGEVTDANDKTDGLGMSEENSLEIYPNPSEGEINLAFDYEIDFGSYQIVNAHGGSVKTGNIQNANELKLDLSNQSPGIYTILITSGDSQLTKKIVIE